MLVYVVPSSIPTQETFEQASGESASIRRRKRKLIQIMDREYSSTMNEDELPPPFYPPAHVNQTSFARDDIVWMKVRGVFIPGVVIQVNKRLKVAKVKPINSQRRDKAFKKPFKELIDFRNHARNEVMLQESKEAYPIVQEAYDKILEYWCISYDTQKQISAAKYLTVDKNDIKVWLNEGVGSTLEEPVGENTSGSNSIGEPTVGEEEVPAISSQEESEDELDLEKESLQILRVVKSCQCFEYLTQIFTSSIPSERHDLFMKKDYRIQSKLVNYSGLGPFMQSTGLKLISILDAILSKIDKSGLIDKCGSRKDYLFYVFLPEAIMFAMRKIYNLEYAEAEQRYSLLSAKAL